MKTSRQELMRVYGRLYRHYGDLHWWPGDSPLEVSVGAVLTQNTAWTNVEKAIQRLKEARSLSAGALERMTHARLALLIRSAGYFNVKAARLKNFISFLQGRYQGSLKKMFRRRTDLLRSELLSVNGIGPETADSILLYAGNKPAFVIDAYTKRIFSRHGILGYEKSYEEFQSLFMKRLPRSAPLYNQYHAMLVNIGKDYCHRRPLCGSCPLKGWRGTPPVQSQQP